MSTSNSKLIARAREVAAAAGQPTVLFGVRAHSDTVFAVCGDAESDASTFAAALEGVVTTLKKAASREASAAQQTLARTSRVDEL